MTEAGKSKEVRNKATVCATMSPWLKKRLEKLVEKNEFASVSDLVSLACSEFITRYFTENDASDRKR